MIESYECFLFLSLNVPRRSAFDKAVKGVSAVVHSSFVMSFEKDPSMTVLKANAKEKSVKRFAYMSSSVAATLPKPGMKLHIGR